MQTIILLLTFTMFVFTFTAEAEEPFEKDIIKTSAGDLEITFIGHGTLMFAFGGKIIHVDPWTRLADYTKLPKADLILVTHEHRDHFDIKAIETVQTEKTVLVYTELCANQLEKPDENAVVMKNGDTKKITGLEIKAIPAYNVVHKRESGVPFHPKGNGNGYIITFGDKKVYVAGDTENTKEMKQLEGIDITFLPMNLPYTMTPEMVADAVLAFKPKILYPYHFGDTDTSIIVNLLKDTKEIEVRIRNMP